MTSRQAGGHEKALVFGPLALAFGGRKVQGRSGGACRGVSIAPDERTETEAARATAVRPRKQRRGIPARPCARGPGLWGTDASSWIVFGKLRLCEWRPWCAGCLDRGRWGAPAAGAGQPAKEELTGFGNIPRRGGAVYGGTHAGERRCFGHVFFSGSRAGRGRRGESDGSLSRSSTSLLPRLSVCDCVRPGKEEGMAGPRASFRPTQQCG